MNKTYILLISLIALMSSVFIIFDVQQLIITPLSQYGINHWLLEYPILICLGYIAITKCGKLLSIIIAGCILLYPALTYTLSNVSFAFSGGVGTFFTSAFVVGMWIGSKKEVKS